MLKTSQEPPMFPPGVSSMSELPGPWWVAHTKSRFEKAFARDLLCRGVGYFLPLVRRVRVVGGKKKAALLPVFPSYVFFCGDQEARGIAMRTNRLCQTIAVEDQGKLLSECAAVEQALAGGAELQPCQDFVMGQRCRVTAGPLRGIEGIMSRREGRTRIMLAITTLGLNASLAIEADLLEPVSECARV